MILTAQNKVEIGNIAGRVETVFRHDFFVLQKESVFQINIVVVRNIHSGKTYQHMMDSESKRIPIIQNNSVLDTQRTSFLIE